MEGEWRIQEIRYVVWAKADKAEEGGGNLVLKGLDCHNLDFILEIFGQRILSRGGT